MTSSVKSAFDYLVDVTPAQKKLPGGFNSGIATCFESINAVVALIGLLASLMLASNAGNILPLIIGGFITVSLCGFVAMLADIRKQLRIIAAK